MAPEPTEAGRELDALVAEKVMGWQVRSVAGGHYHDGWAEGATAAFVKDAA